MYRLYVKFPNQKYFRPVNWRTGKQVINLIYASLFQDWEIGEVIKDLNSEPNKGIAYEFRKAT